MIEKVNKTIKWNGPTYKAIGKKVVSKSVYAIGLAVESQAKLLCPRDTGYLAASINTQTKTEGDRVESPTKYGNGTGTSPAGFTEIEKPTKENVCLVGSYVEYAIWQEMGTCKMNAQPFLRPAFDLVQGRTLEIVTYNGKTYFKDYLE